MDWYALYLMLIRISTLGIGVLFIYFGYVCFRGDEDSTDQEMKIGKFLGAFWILAGATLLWMTQFIGDD
jgi:hypothetical protein